jgi:hypothetical protein
VDLNLKKESFFLGSVWFCKGGEEFFFLGEEFFFLGEGVFFFR